MILNSVLYKFDADYEFIKKKKWISVESVAVDQIEKHDYFVNVSHDSCHKSLASSSNSESSSSRN